MFHNRLGHHYATDHLPQHPLKVLRIARCLSQPALAKAAGVARRTICGIERWEVWPRFDTRRRILRALGVPFEKHPEVFPDPTTIDKESPNAQSVQD